MPAKPVLQYSCNRCTRVWYSEVAEPVNMLELKADLGDGEVVVNFECLCIGCRKTVRSLVEAMGRFIVKNSPIRGAKNKAGSADEEGPPPADPKTTPLASMAVPAAAVGSPGSAPKTRPQQPEILVVAAVGASETPPVALSPARPSTLR